eukprot:TRINITY_DN12716_c0_g1_i1.p1 TRINITY_DN12716_c0_g1~~TRINITY_DN12716_c0_g1_i1.p1  ORF type:complete len:427 (-),score=86.20 TRINITY_DN12716_c0_g1_i1:102-1262(-)
MVKAAIHPNGANFRRAARLDIVARTRRLCEVGLIKERPKWLEWCERVPPMELHNLHMQARTVRNPYPRMLDFLLKKHPDLRFQDCYVDGNDWSVGNDVYRNDHPAMQFVARQLELMREEGLSKKEAFAETEELFRGRREHLEREQKVMMAMMAKAGEEGLQPMFTTGRAYLEQEKARNEAAHLNHIRQRLRELRRRAEEEQAKKLESEGEKEKDKKEEPKYVDQGFLREGGRRYASKHAESAILGEVPREVYDDNAQLAQASEPEAAGTSGDADETAVPDFSAEAAVDSEAALKPPNVVEDTGRPRSGFGEGDDDTYIVAPAKSRAPAVDARRSKSVKAMDDLLTGARNIGEEDDLDVDSADESEARARRARIRDRQGPEESDNDS